MKITISPFRSKRYREVIPDRTDPNVLKICCPGANKFKRSAKIPKVIRRSDKLSKKRLKQRMTELNQLIEKLNGVGENGFDPSSKSILILKYLKEPISCIKTFPHLSKQKKMMSASDSLDFKLILRLLWNQLQKICLFLTKRHSQMNFLASEWEMREEFQRHWLKTKLRYVNLPIIRKNCSLTSSRILLRFFRRSI